MLHFFISHIRTHLFRSMSMFLISSILVIEMIVLLFFYQNIAGVLTRYSYGSVNEKRFTLNSDTNLFSLFAKNTQRLPTTLATELETSGQFEKIQSFSLVEIPVVAKFSLFSFALETDIPVFSVTDNILSGSSIPVGISRSMVDFYNLQFAGSSPMFPKVNEEFLIGQMTRLTFGASKIFPSLPSVAAPIDGTIVRIGDDFPGFGLVIPEGIARDKMQEIGYTLAPPYKIVAYMKDLKYRELIEQKYRAYNPEFDIDAMAKTQEKIYFFRNIFLGISLFFVTIFSIFFVILLFSFFRERRDVFRVVYIFGLSGFRARALTLSEPFTLIIGGTMFGSCLSYLMIGWLTTRGTLELINQGIGYVLIPVQGSLFPGIGIVLSIFFGGVIAILEYVWRKKSLMR